jgi:hypothetical protein
VRGRRGNGEGERLREESAWWRQIGKGKSNGEREREGERGREGERKREREMERDRVGERVIESRECAMKTEKSEEKQLGDRQTDTQTDRHTDKIDRQTK